jgi:phosphohistidine phosphatase SixA
MADEPATAPAAEPRPLQLFFLRHADAGDAASWPGDDAGMRPDALLTSPLLRAAETADLVGRKIGRKPAIEPRLAPGFDAARLKAVLADADPATSRVMLVGHDPDFSSVVSSLVGGHVTVQKGALVLVELPAGQVAARRGVLRWLVPPDAVAG